MNQCNYPYPYHNMDESQLMEAKKQYLEFHGYALGTDESEQAWKAKFASVFKHQSSAMVMGDIQPYISQIDGSLIESRSKHRTHLKDHGCIEVGNETKYLGPKAVKPPPGLKQEIIEQVNAKLRYK